LGLVLDGRVHRGAHGAAGEFAVLPLSEGGGVDPDDARRRGQLEAAASAAAVVRAARRSGKRGSTSARRVFAAAAAGETWAQEVVSEEVELVAKAILSVVAVVDPELVVLGGGIGRAPGFSEAVVTRLRDLAPVVPDVHVSALGDDAVVAGCITAGVELAWERLLDRA
jgi:predicted NBD/HSP70 family sugar kinase